MFAGIAACNVPIDTDTPFSDGQSDKRSETSPNADNIQAFAHPDLRKRLITRRGRLCSTPDQPI